MKELATRIRLRRESLNMTQEELSKHLNLKSNTISSYETNKSSPDAEKLKKISNILNTTTDYLLGNTDNPEIVNAHEKLLVSLSSLMFKEDDLINIVSTIKTLGFTPDEFKKLFEIYVKIKEIILKQSQTT